MAAQQRLNIIFGANVDQFKRAIAGIQKDLGRFSRQAESAGRTLTQSLTVPLGLAGAAAIRSFGQFERLENALAAVMGSSEGARAEIEKLRKTAEAPGLGFEQAVQASARLQAVGLSADEARETITQFGNAVARSGGGAEALDGAVLALTQIQSKGKISAEEINQLNERIFEIRPALEAAFGTSNSEELQKLGVSSEEFISKVTAEFAKLERVNGGVANSFENFFDSVKTSLSVLGAEINTVFNISGALDKLSGVVNEAVTRFKALDDGTKRFILSALAVSAAIGPVLIVIAKLASLQSVLLSGVKLLSTGLAAFASPVGIAVVAVGLLVAGLVKAYNTSEEFRGFIEKTGRAIKVVFNAAGAIFNQFKGIAVAAFGLIQNTVIAFVSVSKARFSLLVGYLQPVFNILGKIREMVTKVAVTAGGILVAAFVGAANSIISGLTEVFKVASDNLSAFARASELVFQGKFKQAFAALPTDIGNQANRIGGAFKSGFNNGVEGTFKFFNDLQAAFNDVEKKAVTAGAAVSTSFGGAATTTPTGGVSTPGTNTPRATLDITAIPTENITAVQSLTTGFDKLGVSANLATATVAGFTETAIANWREVENMGLAIDDVSGRALPNLNSIIQLGASVFSEYVQDGITGMKDLASGVLKATLSIVKAFIQQGVAAAVSNALKNPAGVIPPLGLALAAAAGAAASGLFSGLIKAIGVPKLAQGGVAFGPSLAVVGDNPGARVDPEVISPLSKLKKLIGGDSDGAYIAEARISGSDLLILMKKAEVAYNRVR